MKTELTGRPPQGGSGRFAGILLVLAGLFLASSKLAAAEPLAATNSLITQPLSRSEAINVALRQNPGILRAQRDVAAAQGVVIQTRAIAIPKIQVTGDYTAVQPSSVDKAPADVPGFSFGTAQSWITKLRLVQSIYEGGRMASAFRAARLTKAQSVLNYQTTVANTVLDVQVAYDDVLLAEQQITVQEASVELLGNELADTTRRFDAGTVPRFNVLRAEVELANARPKLIRARNGFRISKNNLANLLGVNIPPGTFEDIPLMLSGKLEAEPLDLELPEAISLAREKRSELGALRNAEALRRED